MKVTTVRLVAPLMCLLFVGELSPVVAAQTETLPNLVPLPASHLELGPSDLGIGPALRFWTIVQNVGDYPFDLLMGPPRGAQDVNFVAFQCVRWKGKACVARRDVGDMYFDTDAGHFHFHYSSFAHYELRRITDGTIDRTPVGLAAEEDKESFCMEDSEPVTPESTTIAQVRKNPPFYKTCNGVNQGISPGWQDDYPSGVAGQQIEIEGVPDGEYALITQLDPNQAIFETDKTDDESMTRLAIENDGTEVKTM